jgi:RNA polymerase sigma-70 factor (ECF subfamily)
MASAKTWLLAIAHNLLIDHYRRGSSNNEVLTDEPIEGPESAPAIDSDLGLEPELELALAGLNDRERELLALRYGGDLSGPEIAEITGLTLANVQQILSRSLRRLRATLEGEETPGKSPNAA